MWKKYYFSLVFQTVLLLILQVFVLNNIRLFGYFLPILYIYPFLKMPMQMPQWTLTLGAFIAGFLVDMLMNTPGINTAAATAAIYFRPNVLRILVEDDELEANATNFIPSFRSMKPVRFLLYLLIVTTVHIGLLMLLEAFSTSLFTMVLPYILGSVVISLLVFIIFESFHKRRSHL